MPDKSVGNATLAQAYRDTRYVCWLAQGEVVLRVGKRAHDSVLDVLAQTEIPHAAIITAYNPRSERQPECVNAASNARLRNALELTGAALFDAEGRGSDPRWTPEPSFLAVGVEPREAMRLATRFGQFAFIDIDAQGMVTLVFTRHWAK